MMRINLSVPDDVAAMMEMFGDVSEVTNKILHLAETEQISVMNKPAVNDIQHPRKLSILVNNEYYEDLVLTYGITSRNISLKRLLCWFFETEQYLQFNWKPKNEYINKRIERFKSVLTKAEADIMTAAISMPEHITEIKDVCAKIRELREGL